jgi:hypothetical protein
MKEHISAPTQELPAPLRLLRAHKQGNALFPQVNMGVVGLVGHEILELKPESLYELLEETPDMSVFEDAAKTMNARHARYSVRAFGVDDLLNVYKTGSRMSVVAVGRVMGLNVSVDSPRSLNALSHLLSVQSPEAHAARLVFSHICEQLSTAEVLQISRGYRTLIGENAPQREQNALIRHAIDLMHESWDEQSAGFTAPFWYMEELGAKDPAGHMKFGQADIGSTKTPRLV